MKRCYHRALCLLTAIAAPLGTMASARNSHPTDFFTTPDTKASGAPEFAGRPQSDSWANGLQNNDGDMPRIDLISAMPSVSGDQRKQLNDLYQTTRKQMQPCYDEIAALQKRLKEIRAEKPAPAPAPPAVATSPAKDTKTAASTAATTTKPAGANRSTADSKAADKPEPAVDLSYIDSLQTEDQVNAKLNDAKKKIRDSADLLRDRMFALLTDQQKEEMIAMRHGTLIIDSDARTDVPPPAPPATKTPVKPAAPAKSATTPATPPAAAAPAKQGTSSINSAGQRSNPAKEKEKETTDQPLMPR